MHEPPRRIDRRRRRRPVGPPALIPALIAIAAIALLVARSGDSNAPSGAAARGDSPGLHWSAATSGDPPSIAAENRQPGTDAWQLPAAATVRPPALAAYVSEQSLRPDALQHVYVDAPGSSWVEASVYRMGWYGGSGGRLIVTTPRVAPSPQPPCTHSSQTGLTECGWHPTFSIRMPRALPSGVYVVKLDDSRGEQRDALFVLEAERVQPLLVQLPVPTWEAYNNWGGDGLYPGYRRVGATGTAQGVEVSFDRPYDSATGAGQFFKFDVALVHYLEQHGYPLTYTTAQSVDTRPGQLAGARAIIDSGHSEYWSQRQYDAFTRARDRGTSIAFLSSDTAAWRVRYLPASAASSEAGAPAHRIVAYKEHVARDPGSPSSGAFPALGARLTGSAYNSCITPPAGQGRYRYYAWHPSAALAPAWLFRGTGLTPASEVAGIVGYELDSTTAATPASALVVGRGSATCRGGPGAAVADTTLYRARSGALVFGAGILGWEFALSPLPSASPDVPRSADARIVRMTDNLLAAMLGR